MNTGSFFPPCARQLPSVFPGRACRRTRNCQKLSGFHIRTGVRMRLTLLLSSVVSVFLLQEVFSDQKICGLLTTSEENLAFDLAMHRLRGAFPFTNFSSLTKRTGSGYDTVVSFQELARSGCQVVIGPRSSSVCTSMKPTSIKAEFPYISNAATNDNVFWQNPYFFRLFSGDGAQAQALVDTVLKFGWRQVIVINGPSTYAHFAAQDFIAACLARDITVLEPIVVNDPQQFNVSTSVLATGRIFVLFAKNEAAAAIYTRAHNVGLLSSQYFWLSNTDAWLQTQNVALPVLRAMQV